MRRRPSDGFAGPAETPRIGTTGRSAAWLAHLLWEQEAGGSNPPAPTVVVFPFDPNFRLYTLGMQRVLWNAVLGA